MQQALILSYIVVMLLIIVVGLVGNIAAIIILFQKEHRRKTITGLMINLASANFLICVCGYPIAVSAVGKETSLLNQNRSLCGWIAFSSACCGFAAIFSLTFMSVQTYKGVTRLRLTGQASSSSTKNSFFLIALVWILSFVIAAPPFFGWNRFVPMETGGSCQPDWLSQSVKDKLYLAFLVCGGFFIPLCVIFYSNFMTYRYIRTQGARVIKCETKCNSSYVKSVETEKKSSKIVLASIISFVVSWCPYCMISLASTIQGDTVIAPEISFIPAVIAKTSAIYFPLIYYKMSSGFRATLYRLINVHVRGRFKRRACTESSVVDFTVATSLENNPRVASRLSKIHTRTSSTFDIINV